MDSSAGTNSTDLYVDSVHIWDDATSSYQQVQAGGVTEGEMDAAITAAVAPKADTADVNASLALKANTADMNASLALKANTADVNASLATKAPINNPTFTGDVLGISAAMVTTTTGNVQSTLNTKASVELLNQAIFDLQQADFDNMNTVNASLATKAPINNPQFQTAITVLENGMPYTRFSDQEAFVGGLMTCNDGINAGAITANTLGLSGLATFNSNVSLPNIGTGISTRLLQPPPLGTLTIAGPLTLSGTVNFAAATVSNLTGLTPAAVGLGNVSNLAPADLPVSTATQTALNLKASLASPTFTGTVGGITASMVGLGNCNNTSDINKPVSSATSAALALKKNDFDIISPLVQNLNIISNRMEISISPSQWLSAPHWSAGYCTGTPPTVNFQNGFVSTSVTKTGTPYIFTMATAHPNGTQYCVMVTPRTGASGGQTFVIPTSNVTGSTTFNVWLRDAAFAGITGEFYWCTVP